MLIIRKIRKLILHPNRYLYDYFRKKLGFKKYFVTDKIRLLNANDNQKWQNLLLTHPYLYLYYKFNKILRNPAYPILVSYSIETFTKNSMGGGEYKVLAVELERKNIIYFADPAIIKKIIAGKEPYLVDRISKFNFIGSGNSIFIDADVKFGNNFRANFFGNNNNIEIGPNVYLLGGMVDFQGSSNSFYLALGCNIQKEVHIQFKGDENILDLGSKCSFSSGLKILFTKSRNYLYAGQNCIFKAPSTLTFFSSNGLMFFCGRQCINQIDAWVGDSNILFRGERTSNDKDVHFWAGATKNLLIGADVMMSISIYLRTYDAHLVYDKSSNKRTNQPKSIIIGDHVWIGQQAMILKGSHVEDGSFIGARSIVTKHVPKNCLAAGCPAKVIKEGIIWDRTSDRAMSKSEMTNVEFYKGPKYEYRPVGYKKLLEIDDIDSDVSAKEKIELIKQIINR